MLHGQKIAFVSIIDDASKVYPDLSVRVWDYQKLVKKLLKNKTCLIGRKTFELTGWKGPNTYVLTKKKKWTRYGVGTIHDLDDLHLFTKGTVYVLGGASLFKQLTPYLDELHIYVINMEEGSEPWIKLDMKDWQPLDYSNRGLWSYAHLEKRKAKN
jgi:dihydrofolate reductase